MKWPNLLVISGTDIEGSSSRIQWTRAKIQSVVFEITQATVPSSEWQSMGESRQDPADHTPLAQLESGRESYNKCKFHTTE